MRNKISNVLVLLILYCGLMLAPFLAEAKGEIQTVKKTTGQEPHFTSPLIFKTAEDYEITKIDIVSIPNINSLKISVKGVKLGDAKDHVVKLLGKPAEINEMGIYFYKDEDGKPLFALVFDNESTVRRVVIYPRLAKYAVGNTKKILTHQIAVDDELRYYLLGMEDDKINSPTGRVTFRYLKEGFEFTYVKIGSEMEDFLFFLKYPAKIR